MSISAPFQYPVTQLYGDLPGYFEVIKTPMDFSTVKKRIKRGHYSNVDQFIKDMRQIWLNAMIYNDEGSEVHGFAVKLSAEFEKFLGMMKEGTLLQNIGPETIDVDSKTTGKRTPKKIRRRKQGRKPRSKSTRTVISKKEVFPMEKKLELTHMIEKLGTDDLLNIWRILAKYNDNMAGKNEIEVNVNKLPVSALNELYTYVSGRIRSKQQQRIIAAQAPPVQQPNPGAMAIENDASLITPQKKEITKRVEEEVKQEGHTNGVNQNQVSQPQVVPQDSETKVEQSNVKSEIDSGSKINAIQVNLKIHFSLNLKIQKLYFVEI